MLCQPYHQVSGGLEPSPPRGATLSEPQMWNRPQTQGPASGLRPPARSVQGWELRCWWEGEGRCPTGHAWGGDQAAARLILT